MQTDTPPPPVQIYFQVVEHRRTLTSKFQRFDVPATVVNVGPNLMPDLIIR